MNILNEFTKKYLKLNKKRTIVTIIGIILSGAMISAVTTLAVSFQSFMINVEKSDRGNWLAEYTSVKVEDEKYIVNNDKFKETFVMAPLHMAQNNYSDEEFLRIDQYSSEAMENMGLRLISGRLPQNTNEIVLSTSFFDQKENEPKIGETIKLPIGKRIAQDGSILTGEIKEDGETFQQEGTVTYTVCGKIERPNFENPSDNYTAGITMLNPDTLKEGMTIRIGIIPKNVKKIFEDTEKVAEKLGYYEEIKNSATENTYKSYNVMYNSAVLMYMGVSGNDGFMNALYAVCAILIAVIAVGSILVIYNSFAISVSERKKQFGMLSSIGATKKQIRKSVIYEGSILGLIGIPLGILTGLGGIWVTLKIVNELLQDVFVTKVAWELEMVVSWPAILIAVVLMALTIYMSVIIPARRASKITPIEAIRQSDDIKVKAKKLKTPRFIRSLFKEEGEIALKNLKRSKKRYRTTVVSLIISIVLFVTVSGFTGYLFTGFDSMYLTADYDYTVIVNSSNYVKKQEMLSKINSLDGIDKCSCVTSWYGSTKVPTDKMENSLLEKMKEDESSLREYLIEDNGKFDVSVRVVFLNKEEKERYQKQLGIKDIGDDEIILINYANMLTGEQIETDITKYKEGDKLAITPYSNREEESKEFTIAKVTREAPFGIETTTSMPDLIAVTTQKGFESVASLESNYSTQTAAFINAKEIKQIVKQVDGLAEEYTDINFTDVDVKEQMRSNQSLKTIISIFLYGFIALISAIGVANVFNTISTNINLRRREFANLKSIGMTDKQFKKMLDLECIFYGTKALLYGIPIGIIICYLLNKSFGNTVGFIFQMPWMSIAIAILAIYMVVFMTMIYSSRKVKRENIIDVLRDDNV